MCGICGYTRNPHDAIEPMTSVLQHRGPDENGYFVDKKIKLGFRRLSILDLETGKQPVKNETGKIHAVFNGEIYNYKELRKELIRKGHRFVSDHSDSEVIVHLYEEYGIKFPERLNGMFSIALWDSEKEKLYLIRDRLGQKPLYYSLINEEIIFASEIKSILKHPEVRKEPDFEALYHYLSFRHVPSPMTPFKSIFALRPASILEYDFRTKKVALHKYWELNFKEHNFKSYEEALEEFRELFIDAVKIRLNSSDVEVGAYLSGGVDSSSVVSIASRYLDSLKTFALGYSNAPSGKFEDLKFSKFVSEIFRTHHYEYIMDANELINDFSKVIKAFDAPFAGTISPYFLNKLVSRHVKVALSGDGADELFGSYLTHRLAQPLINYAKLKGKKSLTVEELETLKPFDENLKFLREIFEKTNGDLMRMRYVLFVFDDFEKKNELLERSFYENNGNFNTFELIKKEFNDLTAGDPLNRILEYELKTIFPDQVLAFVDFLSMAHSVEVRSPFLDYRLVEFVSRLPGTWKINKGVVKKFLKDAVQEFLPEEVTNRKKEGFVLPNYYWLKLYMKDYVYELLNSEKLKKHGMLNPGYVERILDNYYGKKENDYVLASKIWTLIGFQVWWDVYFG
ncbi:asparagine synthase (glutamine-hydrolyzing) [Thermosipho ferrireducens]|uniref:asparagine synthase (glutamine-hydrolyzing) n=1 Tax=Thermosipho ferrireducens TaxID=2571116 RepID=A0ABX7S9P5_9BACT|nr:asparagine synthase (glutamine-hydrolyzing) [Thermosipho ferrireducens]QTA38631.1 asparagine synthase (glutamine-hydrolyzing) [Thermosipho ferrireducens]